MLERFRARLIVGILLLMSNLSFSQSSQSPYSALGMGEVVQPFLVSGMGMGGISIANPNNKHFNLMNPALLGVRDYFTTFEAGFTGESRTITQNDLSQVNGSGNLMYLALAFPIKQGRWASGIGMVPYTYTDYNIVSISPINGIDEDAYYNFRGKGGLNSLFWSNGVKIGTNLSLGVKVSYLFGSRISETIIKVNQPNAYDAALYEQVRVRDLNFGFGGAYRIVTGETSQILIGGIYELETYLNGEVNEFLERRTPGTEITLSTDTISYDENREILLPRKIGIGISYVRSKILIGADVIVQNWGKRTDIQGENNSYTNSYRSSVGIEFIPDAASVSSYFKRMKYRTGFSYELTPYNVDNEQIFEFGINFGVSLPIRPASQMDMAIQYGQRGGSKPSAINESYIRFSLGVTINDVWFFRRKID